MQMMVSDWSLIYKHNPTALIKALQFNLFSCCTTPAACMLTRLTQPSASFSSSSFHVIDAEKERGILFASTRITLFIGEIIPAFLATVTAVWMLSPRKIKGNVI